MLDGAGDEPLDLIDEPVDEPEVVIDAREPDEARPGDAIRHPSARLDRDQAVAVGVQHERRHAHRRQDVAYVDLFGGFDQRPGHARACRRPHEHPKRTLLGLGRSHARSDEFQGRDPVAPMLEPLSQLIADELSTLKLLSREILGCDPRGARERPVQDQRSDPLWAHRGHQHRGGATFGDAKQHGPL